MMELGEGLCKLKKMNFESGPFHQFEQEISEALDFIYQTQIELAACKWFFFFFNELRAQFFSFHWLIISRNVTGGDDLCLAMDQSERSYQLLGGYAAGEQLYSLQKDTNDVTCVVFYPQRTYGSSEPPKVKLPILNAREEHLIANGFNWIYCKRLLINPCCSVLYIICWTAICIFMAQVYIATASVI